MVCDEAEPNRRMATRSMTRTASEKLPRGARCHSVPCLLLLSIFTLCSCGRPGSDGCRDSDTPEIVLEPRMMLGDSVHDEGYAFGTISDADFLSSGNIAVLDRIRCCVLVYSDAGEYLYSFGRDGSGPGEFQSPDCMVLRADTVAVIDRRAAKIAWFLETGHFLGELSVSTSLLPRDCERAGSSLLIGGVTGSLMNGTEADMIYMVILFDSRMSAVDTLFINTFTYDPLDIAQVLRNTSYSCSFTADAEGNLFIAPASTETYEVFVLSPVLDTMAVIRRDLEPAERTPEEIAQERELMTASLEALNPGMVLEYEPLCNRYMIPPNGLYTDSLGRIWVRNGLGGGQAFDVYDYAGDLQFTVEAEGIDPNESNAMLRWSISRHGLLAFSLNSYENPRVYVYDLPEDPW